MRRPLCLFVVQRRDLSVRDLPVYGLPPLEFLTLDTVSLSRFRYRHVEQQLQEKKMRLMSKQPEIQKCLDAINLLIDKRDQDEDVQVDFPLADQVYARAKVHKDTGYVGLWLGAGVMVEYGLEEAKGLLDEQLVSCEQQLTEVDEDWGYVADQTTTTQVTLARLYNHSVELARASRG